ncbi:hypothetical protein, variant [Aphanomyces astaci]|uniref:Uncharacterized protein n=1 Tax=Aphanomyces astaci TaxID=112090 RepID=W4FAG4_APHAT|nr:hypothetical protein, variant [Aphanomyces astaci]ETV64447.1 hypothetical protein, variant [Aphanomyces astaci]|eukprot:XP_009846078.1 hypothetical protein, variant [Aphanomyces astaci]
MNAARGDPTVSAAVADAPRNELEKLEQLLTDVEVEPELTKDQFIDILKERLNRRNMLIDVIRRAYYHDVVVIKEGLLAQEAGGSDERVNALPSVDLRDTLPLFAPSETYLKVHPCEKCGGVVELVHGETRELNDARQQCHRALKAEQHMKGTVHRLRGELKGATEISDALHQRIRGLMKENAFTLEQLQVARKAERDQKSSLAELKSKLQHATATADRVAKLTHQVNVLTLELDQSNKQRTLAETKRDDLQDEYDQLQDSFTMEKQLREKFEGDASTFHSQYEASKAECAVLLSELQLLTEKHKVQVEVDEILQTALSKVKEDLAHHVTRSEQIKRQLEDQLMAEEVAREDAQDKFVEEKKRNKQMQRDMEAAQREAAVYQDQFNELLLKRDVELSANQVAFEAQFSSTAELNAKLTMQVEILGMWENEWLSQLRSRVCDDSDDDGDDSDDDQHDWSDNEDDGVQNDFASPVPDHRSIEFKSSLVISPTRLLPSKLNVPEQPVVTKVSLVEDVIVPIEDDVAKKRKDAKRGTVVRRSQTSSETISMLKDIEDAKERNKTQKHRIHDLEKILASSKIQIAELSMSNQVLQSSLQDITLKATEANQSESQTTASLRDARDQVEVLTKNLQRMERKVEAFEGFILQLGSELYYLAEDPTLLTPVAVSLVLDVPEDKAGATLKNGLTMDMMAKKQAIQQQLFLDQVLNNYIVAYSERVEICCGNIKRAQDSLLELSQDLMLSKRKIDNQMHLLQQSAVETEMLKRSLEEEKIATSKLDRVVKITVAELNDVNEKMRGHKKMVEDVDVERNKLQEEKRKIAFIMMDKSKTLDREIDLNEQLTKQLQSMEAELAKTTDAKTKLYAELQVFLDDVAFRKATNQDVGVMVEPVTRDAEMQSDKWKPQVILHNKK